MCRKLLNFLAVLAVFSLILSSTVFAEVLHEEKTSTVISKGVVRENIKRFTNEGWLNINVLKVDLTDPYIKLDTIFSKAGISYRSTVLDMAKDNGVIAAVNADFFSPKPNSNLGQSIGPVVQSGKLITSSAEDENKNSFSVFSLDKNNTPSYLYWSKDMKVTAPNGQSKAIFDINKFGWFEFLYKYDSSWGPKTIGKSDTFPTLTEMVVANDKVQSFSIASGPIDIPKNGYVISGDYEAGKFLQENFKVGDKVKLDINTTPDWKSMKMAVGGGAILLSDGNIPTFSHLISGRHPRTALGTTKDNKHLFIVTVDGRQLESYGMTQTELANFLLELGAYNAINLDGGGSTTMVTRDLGHSELKTVNNYTGNETRSVVDGVGVFTTAPKGKLSGIKIETLDANIFKNASRTFSVVGYDQYSNPMEVDQTSVKWAFEGVLGKFVDNNFYPTSSGKGKVIAQVNGLSSSIDVNVLDTPAEIEIYPNSFPVSSNSQWMWVNGIDKNGYKAFLNTNDLKIDTKDIVTVNENFIKSKNGKSGNIKVSFGDVYSYFSYSSPNITLDSFEKDTDKFWGYPSTVLGSYSVSDKYSKDGKNSGKLEFDFSTTDGTKGAYIKLGNGYKINSKPQNVKVKVWVYAPERLSHSIKAEFSDANDKVIRTNFASKIDWTGWKQVSTTLPADAVYPVKLNKIYVVETDPSVKNTGELYFDKLEVIYGSSSSKIPSVKKLRDSQQRSAIAKSNDNSFNFSIFGSAAVTDSSLIGKTIDTSNKSTNFSAFLGDISSGAMWLNNKYTDFSQGFKFTDYKNSKIITLSSKGTENSIRLRDSKQWKNLFNTLNSNTKDNVFILLDSPINGDYGFSDMYEGDLLKNTLSEYVQSSKKNVWVIYSSDKLENKNENGVKYIGLPGYNTGSNKNNILNKKYVNIVVNGKDLTYQFKFIQ